jgi:hypothetical protein
MVGGATPWRKYGPTAAFGTSADSPALSHHAILEILGPIAVCEVVPVIQKECARLFKILAHPDRRVQRAGQPVPCLDRGYEISLKRQCRAQPYIRQEHVTRSKAMIERASGRSQPFSYRGNRYRRRSACCGEIARSRKKIGILEKTFRHLLEHIL